MYRLGLVKVCMRGLHASLHQQEIRFTDRITMHGPNEFQRILQAEASNYLQNPFEGKAKYQKTCK